MNAIASDHPAKKIRALFLSDFHFGYRGADAAAILDCLKSYSPQVIYLIGDIVDGWKLEKRWFWVADYTRVLDALVDHRRRGVKIVYLPGNHDERVRHSNIIARTQFCLRTGLKICNHLVHRTKDGRKLIVLHGDQFDNLLMRGRLSKFSDRIMEFFTEFFDYHFPRSTPSIMVDGKPRRFSLAKALVKKSGKFALRMLGTMDRAIIRLVKRKGLNGLVCGHTHMPKTKMLRQKYFYGNAGTWMGYTNTALVETMDGEINLVKWPDMRSQQISIPASQAVHIARHYETALTIRRIRQLWPARKGAD